jgi:hypothetical protein
MTAESEARFDETLFSESDPITREFDSAAVWRGTAESLPRRM